MALAKKCQDDFNTASSPIRKRGMSNALSQSDSEEESPDDEEQPTIMLEKTKQEHHESKSLLMD